MLRKSLRALPAIVPAAILTLAVGAAVAAPSYTPSVASTIDTQVKHAFVPLGSGGSVVYRVTGSAGAPAPAGTLDVVVRTGDNYGSVYQTLVAQPLNCGVNTCTYTYTLPTSAPAGDYRFTGTFKPTNTAMYSQTSTQAANESEISVFQGTTSMQISNLTRASSDKELGGAITMSKAPAAAPQNPSGKPTVTCGNIAGTVSGTFPNYTFSCFDNSKFSSNTSITVSYAGDGNFTGSTAKGTR